MIHWELFQNFRFYHTNKWYRHNPESILENEMHKILWEFEIQMDHLILARRPDWGIVHKKKRTCQIMDFTISAYHRVKLKESEKRDKYLDLARELKKLWNMKVTVKPIIIGTLGTVTKGQVQGLKDSEMRGRVENIQTTALLRLAKILKRVL